jgi:CAAX prenyl protease-like protein
MAPRFDWRLFGILLAAGLAGVAGTLPYLFEMFASVRADVAPARALALPLVVALALLQNAVLLGVAIAIGMALSRRVGLRMPLLQAWAHGERHGDVAAIVRCGVLVGAAVGAVMVAVEAMFFLPHLPDSIRRLFEIPLWKRLAAGVLYGGITEEILMRLFLLSTVVWLLGRWWRTAEGLPARGAVRTSIMLVSVLFGLGHLPATSALAPLTLPLVIRALVLNGIAGVAFGYLFWRKGLEAAMVAHATVHLVLQVPGTMLLTALR